MNSIDARPHLVRQGPRRSEVEARIANDFSAEAVVCDQSTEIEFQCQTRMPRGKGQLGGHVHDQRTNLLDTMLFEVFRGKCRGQQTHRVWFRRPPGNSSTVLELISIVISESPSEKDIPLGPTLLDFPSMGGLIALGERPFLSGAEQAVNVLPFLFGQRRVFVVGKIDGIDDTRTRSNGSHVSIQGMAYPGGQFGMIIRHIKNEPDDFSHTQFPAQVPRMPVIPMQTTGRYTANTNARKPYAHDVNSNG
ncbi:hypothetical protein MEBOL_000748 [Melittangium boletus DSM 14713]|uniref:Uncharacterized protein n=1 Tax=Melittangium boletus DSM 14713 TaxID=1294270 RepID=A0A250I7Z1_9BACT|nr:hypothetical protein MEBOL_000748 [Melittangium boletus DSM 14713]